MANDIPASYFVREGKMIYEYYNPIFLELQQEIAHHPELRMSLASHPSDKFEERLAEVAVYCDVLLDGYYTPQKLVEVAEVLLYRLKEKRHGVILLKP